MKYLIIAILILTSCGPQAKLRRAAKLIAKAELQGAQWHSDTVFVDKQIITRERHTDTLIQKVNFRDTITVIEDKVVTKIKYDTIRKTMFVSTKVPADTVEILVPVTVTREIKAKGKPWYFYAAWLLILLIIGFIAGWIVRGKKGNININFEKPPDQQ